MADADPLAAFETIEEQEPVVDSSIADQGGSTVTYSGTRISGFKEMLLRPELYRALADASFEHPSEVQHQCISPAILGRDILCQAKSGMGKTAVFVLSTLQRLKSEYDAKDGRPRVLVICHTHEMAHQIVMEYERFARHMPKIRDRIVKVHGGKGRPRDLDVKAIRDKKPIIVVGCPGRLRDLAVDPRAGKEAHRVLDLSKVEMFVVDECDKLLDSTEMVHEITSIFVLTPKQKQVMMFSATMPQASRVAAKKYMSDPLDIFVDSERQLTLHGLAQYFLVCDEKDKAKLLTKFIDENVHLNQTVIFVKSIERAKSLAAAMNKASFPTLCIHGGMLSEERTRVYDEFKACGKRFLVATEVFARGVDVQAVTVVINFDAPCDRTNPKTNELVLKGSDQYFHRVGRAGRFGTKGVALTFVSSAEDKTTLESVQKRFEVQIQETSPDKLGTLTDSLAAA